MSFGYSVGDFVALGQLAWKIYKACKDAPEGFKNVSQEVLSLHAVLKEVEETYSVATLSVAQQSRQRIVGDGCRCVLEDLQSILDRYNSLGTKTKKTWDRLGWCSRDIADLRFRLISNTSLLTAFVNASQVTVQKNLDVFMQESRAGKHEGSIVSTQTVDSLSTDEKQAWRAIRKELEEIGISVTAFDANKNFIVDWFKTAISTGAFEEQAAEDGSSSILNEDDQSQSLEDERHDALLSQPLDDPRHDGTLTSNSVDNQPLKLSTKAKIQRRRPPRVASLINWLFRYNNEFIKAVRSEDESKICQLLDKDVDVNVKDNHERTALHLAAMKNSISILQLLLENGANIDEKDGYDTALHLAAKYGHETVVQLLLENGANIDEKREDKDMALHLAARHGHETVVQFLLNNGADIDGKGIYERTALHMAAGSGHKTVVQLLLEMGVRIDEKDEFKDTALHLAATHGHETVVQLLLNNGADIDGKGMFERTALHMAARGGYKTVVQLLLGNGVHFDEKDEDKDTALHLAATHGHETVVQLLLNNGADIDGKCMFERTALHMAARGGHKTVVQLLLKNTANINVKDDFGETARRLAIKENQRGAAKILRDAGALE